MPPRILLATAAAWLGVARVPRILAEAGARVCLLAHPRRPVARSRHVAELFPAPRDTDGALAALKRLLAGQMFDWVILGDDEILRAAARDGGVPGLGMEDLLVSKAAFARAMASKGLPFPDAQVAIGPDAARAAAGRIGFPVILKPDASTAGAGLFRADRPEDVGRVPEGAPYVVQRFVDGDVGSTAILLDGGRPLFWMSAFKSEVHPKPFGPSCVRRYVHVPGFEPRLEALAAMLPGRRLCGVDWILPRGASEPLFLELNARPPPWVHLHARFGADLPGAIRAMLAGAPVVVRPPERVSRPDVRMFPQDAIRALDEGDWKGFLRGFLAWGTGYDAPRGEPLLLLALRWQLVRRAWARLRGRSAGLGGA
ncbi:MAG TPA: hypothetical protein VFY93_04420 [Planctomycetota bacterium]|nr:hypothetical protein [Planctomycetota bacterium]